MDIQVLHDCLASALQGKMGFPETIQRMAATGVERYRADLVRMEKMHYSADGETHLEAIPLAGAPRIPTELSREGVKAALLAVQRGENLYDEFLSRIMAAGVTDYGVWLRGRLAIYFGGTGDFYVEHFPGK